MDFAPCLLNLLAHANEHLFDGGSRFIMKNVVGIYALFTSHKKPKTFQDFLSHRILWYCMAYQKKRQKQKLIVQFHEMNLLNLISL